MASPATVRRSTFDITFGNITTWGRKPKAYLAACEADLALLAETHLDQAELDSGEIKAEIAAAGFKFSASAASPTGRGGTHGGTMVWVRRHLECKFFPEDQPQDDCSFLGLRLRGLNVAIIALYLDDQKDHAVISRANLDQLQAVLLLVKR